MDIKVRGDGSLTDYHFGHHIRPSQEGMRRIDLTNAQFVDPFGLVAIAALAERATAKGLGVRFTAPQSFDCSSYLYRMGLGAVLDDLGVVHDLTPVRSHPVGDRLLTLRRFDAQEDAADALAEQVFRIFEDQDERTAATLYDAINEIAQNVVEHSGREGGYVALQQFPRTSEVTFAVADSGMGLRRRLSTRHTVRDDAHAIGLAVRRDITTKSKGGVGLHSFVGHTRSGGRVQLWSGDSSGSFSSGEIVPVLTRHRSTFHGTVAQARLGVQ